MAKDLKNLLAKLLDEQELKLEHDAFKENTRYDAHERFMDIEENIVTAASTNPVKMATFKRSSPSQARQQEKKDLVKNPKPIRSTDLIHDLNSTDVMAKYRNMITNLNHVLALSANTPVASSVAQKVNQLLQLINKEAGGV